jgi:hypothetical protein
MHLGFRQLVSIRVLSFAFIGSVATACGVAEISTGEPIAAAEMFADQSMPPATIDGGVLQPPDSSVVADSTVDSFVPPQKLKIAVIADLNGSYGTTTYGTYVHKAVAALRDTIKPDIVLVAGDMVAGQKAGLDYRAMWAGFHQAVTTPLINAGIVVAVTPGNHDASAYSGYTKERQIFDDEWNAPARVPPVTFIDGSTYPLRYSFVYGGVFFLSIDATTVGSRSAADHLWIEEQLQAAAPYPVKIAFGHIPLYAVAKGVESQTLKDKTLLSLFATYGVSFYVAGHHHAYYPGAKDGVRIVASACLGAAPRPLIGESIKSDRSIIVAEVDNDVLVSLEALKSPDFVANVPRATLPQSISYGGNTLIRDDVAGF